MNERQMTYDEAVGNLKKKLAGYRPIKLPTAEMIPAAVMILLTNIGNIPHLLLTKRTELVEHHKGQVSFPGGTRDPEDRDLLQTALRETREEIGVEPGQIEVVGALDDFPTVTNFLISPYAGLLSKPPDFRLSRDEVAEVLQVPLSFFLTDTHFEIKKWKYEGETYDVFFYYFNHHVIWGATAFIMNRFIEIIFGYNPAPYSVLRDPRNRRYLEENRIRRGSRNNH